MSLLLPIVLLLNLFHISASSFFAFLPLFYHLFPLLSIPLNTDSYSICDFKNIFEQKDVTLLEQYIETYKNSSIDSLKSFANGLFLDINAVKNSISSDLSNGYVDGINNKIKVIKRIMYGRAKLNLLTAKILHAN